MKWFLRVVLWSVVLAYPSTLIAGAYQRGLIAVVAFTLGYHIRPQAGLAPDLGASNMLGVYAAMCLASTAAPGRARALAIALGLLAMAGIECATGLIAIGGDIIQEARGEWPSWAQKAFEALLSVPRFSSGPAMWLALLGHHELSPAWQAILPSWKRSSRAKR
jgi:hypothetical protein